MIFPVVVFIFCTWITSLEMLVLFLIKHKKNEHVQCRYSTLTISLARNVKYHPFLRFRRHSNTSGEDNRIWKTTIKTVLELEAIRFGFRGLFGNGARQCGLTYQTMFCVLNLIMCWSQMRWISFWVWFGYEVKSIPHLPQAFEHIKWKQSFSCTLILLTPAIALLIT